MAKQRGVLQVSGTMAGITFYKTADGYLVRAKSSLNKAWVSRDPAFAASRKANAEFGRAGAAAKLLQTAFITTAARLADSRVLARLTGRLTKLMPTDTTHPKGERLVGYCALGELESFQWNNEVAVEHRLLRPLSFGVDDATGTVSVTLPLLKPAQDIQAPSGATHYEILMGGAAIDFEGGKWARAEARTGWLALDADRAVQVLSAVLQDYAGRWMFVGAGIRFGVMVGGVVSELAEGRGFVMG